MLTRGDKRIFDLIPGDLIRLEDVDLLQTTSPHAWGRRSLFRMTFWKSLISTKIPIYLGEGSGILILNSVESITDDKELNWAIVNYFSNAPKLGIILKHEICESLDQTVQFDLLEREAAAC